MPSQAFQQTGRGLNYCQPRIPRAGAERGALGIMRTHIFILPIVSLGTAGESANFKTQL